MELLFIGLGFLMSGASGWGICAAINRIFFRFEKNGTELYGALLFFLTILMLQIGLAIVSMNPKTNLAALANGLPGCAFAYFLFRVKAPLKPISIAFIINALIYSVGSTIFGYWGILNYLMTTLTWSGFGFAAVFVLWVAFGMKSIPAFESDRFDGIPVDKGDRTNPSIKNWTE